MENINFLEAYQKIANEVAILNKELLAEIELNPNGDLKKVYKGCQILYSPLVFNPKFMFIGINPGAGYSNYEKKYVEKYLELESHEYITHAKNIKHPIAMQTVKMMEKSNLEVLLSKSVKSNFYYFATANEKELKQLIDSDKKNLKLNIHLQSRNWTIELINVIKPEIIICEGKNSFEKITKVLNANIDKTVILKNDGVNISQTGNLKIVGYHRRFSQIKNLDKVAKYLKNL